MKPLPSDFRERIYAGVLGKIIGVYLGRPFEQWPHDKIEKELGEIRGYVHEQLGQSLVVADDDISGTFSFVRALEDYPGGHDIEAASIGDLWLNLIIEKRTILWWGGRGRSAEHTAFLNLQEGVRAPESGSIALCGEVMAQQIGAQIFIDGWGLICPGEPEKAAALAWKAGSVSHDGEALYGAQVIAAMVAAAFEVSDVNELMDIGLAQVPEDCLIRQMADDVRAWVEEDQNWRATLKRIQDKWGYDRWPGGCHILPNHAVVLLALAAGKGAFGESMAIVNTAGYDTDCNSGNVGCILGVAGGLKGLEDGGDWRGPVADRMLLPTADAGRVITDAVRETDALMNIALKLRGLDPLPPQRRFHFSLPGSVQGFEPAPGSPAVVAHGDGYLVIKSPQAQGKVFTPTWLPPDARTGFGYSTQASPTLYPGQTIEARVSAPEGGEGCTVSLCLEAVLDGESPTFLSGPDVKLAPGETKEISWPLTLFQKGLISHVGLMVGAGEVHLHSFGWTGTPKVSFTAFEEGSFWKKQFVAGVEDEWPYSPHLAFAQNRGTGLLITGTSEWTDYRAEAVGLTFLAKEIGLAVRVTGMRRWVALVATKDGRAQLVRQWDGERVVLDEAPLDWALAEPLEFVVEASGSQITGRVKGVELKGEAGPVTHGGIGLLLTEGSGDFISSRVDPLGS